MVPVPDASNASEVQTAFLTAPLDDKEREALRGAIEEVPGFPIETVLFRDISGMMMSHAHRATIVKTIKEHYADKRLTKVLGIESRGFIFGILIAEELDAGFVMLRKKGKLPGDLYACTYDLEYGTNQTMEIQKRHLDADDVVLIHDDILATGGTLGAAIDLCRQAGIRPENIYVNTLVQLDSLNGDQKLKGLAAELFTLLHIS
ncbi:Adenine phosphoribosyltransferase [Giardia muris]|uniref:adenine phosphoribosyltransferase n=1 Tax=Giardia muris TaxID=5742 RepID=A0A4Z1T1Y0_GIAMU|nr:Adenine phosphoribosyltransferase [Giardia muris]|eukprot:TNJ26997.1 Adenine phosphoribosyltransferase [Giardia muris]